MAKITFLQPVGLSLLITLGSQSWAQEQHLATSPAGLVVFPQSSIRRPQALAAGFEQEAQAFTNITVFIPSVQLEPPTAASPMASGYFIETPASLACVYGLVPQSDGCNPNIVRANPAGGQNVIAVVDAYDAPNAASDLAVFSQRFNLPPADFEVVFASGKRPTIVNKGWELETSLDIEWAHAMAPEAKIVLVEANSNSYKDLLLAEDMASQFVASHGGGEVSNSWGAEEFSKQTGADFDGHFLVNNVVYFAASGDTPGVSWPSTSNHVVCVGGTSISRDATGSYIEETAWVEAGAGPSHFEPRGAKFQDSVAGIVRNVRGCVDVSAIADASKGGVWVYDSGNPTANANHGWVPVGGTSAATPIVAAIANTGGHFYSKTEDQLLAIYTNESKFYDVKVGTCGPRGSYKATAGWDFCTGIGRPNGKDVFK